MGGVVFEVGAAFVVVFRSIVRGVKIKTARGRKRDYSSFALICTGNVVVDNEFSNSLCTECAYAPVRVTN